MKIRSVFSPHTYTHAHTYMHAHTQRHIDTLSIARHTQSPTHSVYFFVVLLLFCHPTAASHSSMSASGAQAESNYQREVLEPHVSPKLHTDVGNLMTKRRCLNLDRQGCRQTPVASRHTSEQQRWCTQAFKIKGMRDHKNDKR